MTSSQDDPLWRSAAGGCPESAAALFERHRRRLERTVAVRIDPKCAGKFDAADVVQDALVTAFKRAARYFSGELFSGPRPSVFVWLRGLAIEQLIQTQRMFSGTDKRDVSRERRLAASASVSNFGPLIEALKGGLTTPSVAAVRGENSERVHAALAELTDAERELLTCLYFEGMTGAEVAEAEGVTRAAISLRHAKALKKLVQILSEQANGEAA